MNSISDIEEELKNLDSKEDLMKKDLRRANIERLDLLDKKRKLLIELINLKTNFPLLKEEIQKIDWKLYYTKHKITDPYAYGEYEFFNLYFEAEQIKGSFIETLINILYLNKDEYKKYYHEFESNIRSWEIKNPFPEGINFGCGYFSFHRNERCIGIATNNCQILIDFIKKFDIKVDLSLFNSQITDLRLVIGAIQDMSEKLKDFKK